LRSHHRLDDHDAVPRFENIREYTKFTKLWIDNCLQYALKPNSLIIIWSNPLGKLPIQTVLEDNYSYKLVDEYIWAKSTSNTIIPETSIRNEVLLRVCETALIFAPKDTSHEHIFQVNSSKFCKSVITGYHPHERVRNPHEHPCHKPSTVLEPLLATWTQPGQLVLDPFAGSGSILCETARLGGGRRVVGFEVLPDWVRLANIELDKVLRSAK